MDQSVIRALKDTQDNLRARRFHVHADAVGRGIAQIEASEEARAKAIEAASVIPGLRAEVDSLKRQIAFLHGEVAKAQDQAKRAAVPRLEALAEARAEVRELLKPFVKDGEQGVRMVAMTIKQSLDERWGKQV